MTERALPTERARPATWCISDWRKVALVRVDLEDNRIVDSSIAAWVGECASDFVHRASKASWSIFVLDLGKAE